jgi:hypothetical protein
VRFDSSALGSSIETVLRRIILLLLSDVYHPLSSAKTRLSNFDLGATIERFSSESEQVSARPIVIPHAFTSSKPSIPSIGSKRNPATRYPRSHLPPQTPTPPLPFVYTSASLRSNLGAWNALGHWGRRCRSTFASCQHCVDLATGSRREEYINDITTTIRSTDPLPLTPPPTSLLSSDYRRALSHPSHSPPCRPHHLSSRRTSTARARRWIGRDAQRLHPRLPLPKSEPLYP